MTTDFDRNDTRNPQHVAGVPDNREPRSVVRLTALSHGIEPDRETATNALELSRAVEKRRRQFNKGLITLEELERLVADGPANLRMIAQSALVGCFRFLRIRAETAVTATTIKRLGSRWIATLDDRGPALGPAGFANLGLPRLVTRATAGVVDLGQRTSNFYRFLNVSAIMGARILIVETEPSQSKTWAKFLDCYPLEDPQYWLQKVINDPGK